MGLDLRRACASEVRPFLTAPVADLANCVRHFSFCAIHRSCICAGTRLFGVLFFRLLFGQRLVFAEELIGLDQHSSKLSTVLLALDVVRSPPCAKSARVCFFSAPLLRRALQFFTRFGVRGKQWTTCSALDGLSRSFRPGSRRRWNRSCIDASEAERLLPSAGYARPSFDELARSRAGASSDRPRRELISRSFSGVRPPPYSLLFCRALHFSYCLSSRQRVFVAE